MGRYQGEGRPLNIPINIFYYLIFRIGNFSTVLPVWNNANNFPHLKGSSVFAITDSYLG